IAAFVQFQRKGGLSNDEFTVNLLRVKAADLQPRAFGGYAGALGARLTHMLWYVHELRDYPASEYWWTSTDRSGLEVNLIDAVNQIEKYGLAWIEDPNAPRPWEMPEYSAAQFVEVLNQVVTPDLIRLGFRSELRRLNGNFPYPYFVKPIDDRQYGIIEFQQVYSVDPKQFDFDVRLQRKATSDPLDFRGEQRDATNISLGLLVWQINASSFPEMQAGLAPLWWKYATRAELIDRLGDVLAKVKQVAIPWFENIELKRQ
ncbi:MAG TPA: hypothetical protein VFF70_01375, partial [Anaerolineae bacterium]|nr:hypothetical protein [Anaerolineae bacterium]